ncbi:hypothetical protein EC988_010052, partial [Linderina pennispora]
MEDKTNETRSGTPISSSVVEAEEHKAGLSNGFPIEAPIEETSIPPPDTIQGWVVVLGAFFTLMMSIGATTAYGVYLQAYKLDEFPNTSSSMLSWIGTLQFSSMCFFGIGVGVL